MLFRSIAHGAQFDNQDFLFDGGVCGTVFTVEALIFVGFAGYMTQEVKTVCMKFHGAKIVFSSQTLAIATFQAQKLSKFVKGK